MQAKYLFFVMSSYSDNQRRSLVTSIG